MCIILFFPWNGNLPNFEKASKVQNSLRCTCPSWNEQCVKAFGWVWCSILLLGGSDSRFSLVLKCIINVIKNLTPSFCEFNNAVYYASPKSESTIQLKLLPLMINHWFHRLGNRGIDILDGSKILFDSPPHLLIPPFIVNVSVVSFQ